MKYYILTYCRAPIGDTIDAKLEYNFANACNQCGTGAKLEGNLQVTGLSKVKKDLFSTLIGDYIISEKLFHTLMNEGIQLGKLKKIVDYKFNPLPYYHLYSEIILPESYKKNGIEIENQCPVCKRNGFFNKLGKMVSSTPTYVYPLDFHYPTSDMQKIPKCDFYLSWECFGYSNMIAYGNNIVGFARPLLIVSEKFKNVLEAIKVKGLKFEPLTIK
jgi:hypothetical protein